MARRQPIKREFTQQPATVTQDNFAVNDENHINQDQPTSTGNTILIDDSSDVTMTDSLVDEGYQTGQGNQKPSKS